MRAMKRTVPILAFAALALASVPALAALPKGAKAPAIVTQGALAGRAYQFDLHKALQKGPVVLYFFPAAFTQSQVKIERFMTHAIFNVQSHQA